ncbi:MAG: hemerythrin domain-containing protein [Gammaproteobacteria bacterium]|nr:MAG: hemerythrin domain-containing protein [Gammaproteobacteria bacterium]
MKSQHKVDAIDLLINDHQEVKKLFKEFDALTDRSKAKKKSIAEKICHELTMHTQIEEEIFYPKVREAIKDSDLMDEALVEHAGAKDLIAQILGMSPGEDLYDAKVTVLSEQIDHHVKEEEEDMFPKVRKSGLDLIALGEQMLKRKNEIKEAELAA